MNREQFNDIYYSMGCGCGNPKGVKFFLYQLMTAYAGDGRPPHGIGREHDYYRNISNPMFSSILHPGLFKTYFLQQVNQDLQFYGIK